jgi:hypothetical protein
MNRLLISSSAAVLGLAGSVGASVVTSSPASACNNQGLRDFNTEAFLSQSNCEGGDGWTSGPLYRYHSCADQRMDWSSQGRPWQPGNITKRVCEGAGWTLIQNGTGFNIWKKIATYEVGDGYSKA